MTMSTPGAEPPADLAALPRELHLHIARWLIPHDLQSLYTLAQTCKGWSSVVRDAIYEYVYCHPDVPTVSVMLKRAVLREQHLQILAILGAIYRMESEAAAARYDDAICDAMVECKGGEMARLMYSAVVLRKKKVCPSRSAVIIHILPLALCSDNPHPLFCYSIFNSATDAPHWPKFDR